MGQSGSLISEPSSSAHHDSVDGSVVVVGGGPAGLTAAYELIRSGRTPIILEKAHLVGGLSRTESYKGYSFDMGGHRFFTKVKRVNEFWKEILAGEFLQRPRLSRIYYKKRFFHYPLKPLNALWGLGIFESILILLSYVRWRLFPCRPEETFEQWVTNRFGRRLFLTFFKTYTEKVWGIPCSELKAEWAAQRIKDLSLKSVVLSMFRKPGTRIKSLIEQFEYPRLGPGMMWTAVSQAVQQHGGEVRLNHDVTRIRREGNRIISIETCCAGEAATVRGEQFISSMPLTELVRKLDPPAPTEVLLAADELKYRDFLTVCLIVNRPQLFEDNWIYIHDPSVDVGRIQNYKNWSPDMVPDPDKTGLGLEYFCSEGDRLWTMPDEELIELGRRELVQLGLAESVDIKDGCVFRVAKSYPVYDSAYREHLGIIRQYVEGLENLQTIGRNGLHRYNNQDHAMLTGMHAVSNLVKGTRHDLWNVNTEQEYHEQVEESPQIDVAIANTFFKIDRLSLGLATGIAAGCLLFAATLFLVLKGGEDMGANLRLLGQYLPGYSVTYTGCLLGLIYGFGGGFAVGWLYALLRNSVLFLVLSITRRSIERQVVRDFFSRM